MGATAWFLLVVAAVIVAFVAYGMARRARGSIDITLPKSDFEPAETIHGQVSVHAKKPIEAERLLVTLTATEVTETEEDGKTTRTSKQVYRGERVLEEVRSYAADARETHEFDIALPERQPTPVPESDDGKAAFKTLRPKAPPKTRLTWRLEARLVAKGIDLVTARQLDVNIDRL